MTPIVEYDPQGRILSVTSGPLPLASYGEGRFLAYEGTLTGRELLDGAFVAEGAVLERPAQETLCDKAELAADGVEVVTLTALPVPCTVRVGVTEYAVTDGVLELSFANPGEYRVTISDFPFLEREFMVRAL